MTHEASNFLTPEQRAHVDRIAGEALDEPLAHRADFVRRHCGDDQVILCEVLALLEHSDEASENNFLECSGAFPPLPRTGAVLNSPDHEECIGSQSGSYVITKMIGEGGCGNVYQAEQITPIRRLVAVKIVKPGMDSARVLARFNAERQALALMDHPSVAKVFDAGTTDRGLPFFVMELVDGVPITTYCDEHRLSLRDRLTLFCRMCDAVQHAHQKGVIHRDLKPGNILVEARDGIPVPRIIDFGIAKALDTRLTDQTLQTEAGLLLGTPEYMSPEQATLGAIDVDTRSDVYSLGVLLYELLTGSLPVSRSTIRGLPIEGVRQLLHEREPSKPSARLASMAEGRRSRSEADSETIQDISSARQSKPAALVRAARGDLDWITMRCLEKEPDCRYTSPGEIAGDIHRHLAGEPVLAASPSVPYRLKKVIRRHRVGVFWGLLTAGTLIGATIVSTTLAVKERRQRHLVEQREGDLQRVSRFQSSVLFNIDPARMGRTIIDDMRTRVRASLQLAGHDESSIQDMLEGMERAFPYMDATAVAAAMLERDVLLAAERALDQQFQGDPLLGAALRLDLAQSYRAIGHYQQSLDTTQKAVQAYVNTLGEHDPLTLAASSALARCLSDVGRSEDAVHLLEPVLKMQERVLGPRHHDTLTSLHIAGGLSHDLGEYVDAEELFRKAVAGRTATLGAGHLDTLASMTGLALSLQDQDEFEEAEQLCRQVVRLMEGNPAVSVRDRHMASVRLGAVMGDRGMFSDAKDILISAVERMRKDLGMDHPVTLTGLAELASLPYTADQTEEIEAMLASAHESLQDALGSHHPRTLEVLFQLARNTTYGERALSELRFRQAMEGYRAVYGPDHPRVYECMVQVANYVGAQGRFEEAEGLLKEALSAQRRILRPDHTNTLATANNLGFLYAKDGQFEQALPYFREALEGYERVHGPSHRYTATLRYNCGELLYQLGRYEEAQQPLQQAWPALLETLGPSDRVSIMALQTYIHTLILLDRQTEAVEALSKAIDALESATLSSDTRADTCDRMAELYDDLHEQFPDSGFGLQAENLRRRATVLGPSQ
ncbi:MAG: serine/threonine protein kinase [Planctomycetes bacterium]|nr:serine/threonine protein kinase [Planctomycetota bacterium]NOG53217.1 serine/threonine protein kinase [Planctomycetota bacterium]